MICLYWRVQKILGGSDRVRYGYEGGAVISWQNDSVSYCGVVNGGATVNIKVENEMFLFGTMLGVWRYQLVTGRGCSCRVAPCC